MSTAVSDYLGSALKHFLVGPLRHQGHVVKWFSAETLLLVLEGPGVNSEVVLDGDDSLDALHSVVVELIGDVLNLLALEVESGVLCLLLLIGLVDKFLQVVDLLIQIFVNVRALGVSHLGHSVSLGIEDLDLFLAEIKFFPGIEYVFFQFGEESHETDIILGAHGAVSLDHLLANCAHY